MDFKNFESTSTYAIEAVYNDYFSMIPEEYRVKDNVANEHINDDIIDRKQKHPMSYKDVEKQKEKRDEEYYYTDNYNNPYELTPFFDPELNFSDRLHYRLNNIDYPKRATPWFIITWNCGKGILHSSLTRRRFQSATIETAEGETIKIKFMNVDMDLTLCFNSNSMQALFELQENILLDRRLKSVVYTRPHPILGQFPVSFDLIDADINKYSREKGTLCNLMLNVKIDYPIIGCRDRDNLNIIKQINSDIYGKDEPIIESQLYTHDLVDEETIISKLAKNI